MTVEPEDIIENFEEEVKQLRAENKRLQTALSGRTYYHDNEAIEKELETLRAELEAVKLELASESRWAAQYKAERDEAYNEGYAAAIAFIANSYQTLGDLNTAAEVRSMHTPETSILCQEREKLVVWANTAVQRAEQAEKERDEAKSQLQGLTIHRVDGDQNGEQLPTSFVISSDSCGFKLGVYVQEEQATLAERKRCAEIAINIGKERCSSRGVSPEQAVFTHDGDAVKAMAGESMACSESIAAAIMEEQK